MLSISERNALHAWLWDVLYLWMQGDLEVRNIHLLIHTAMAA